MRIIDLNYATLKNVKFTSIFFLDFYSFFIVIFIVIFIAFLENITRAQIMSSKLKILCLKGL